MKTKTMTKRILTIAICICCWAHAMAQKPEKIYSIAKVLKPGSYYKEQAILWQKEVQKDPKNADAWVNYYAANRYATMDDTTKQGMEHSKKMNDIVKEMGKAIPNTFEYNYTVYRQGGLDLSLSPYLFKAYNMDPNRVELWDEMATYYEVMNDVPNRQKFSRMMYEAKDRSTGFLNYDYNMLVGLDKDAIIVTVGDNDTYPCWMLQAAKGFRKDVLVINSSLIYLNDYRKHIFEELGIEKSGIPDSLVTAEDYNTFQTKMVKALITNKKHRPVYVAVTAGEEFMKPLKDNFYLTGLAYKYSPTRIDNIAILKKNFEQNYALDYLTLSFEPDISDELVKIINFNYIVPMLTLYDHYKLAGETEKAERLKKLALNVSAQCEHDEDVKKYFEKN
jgi:hypothetical protein